MQKQQFQSKSYDPKIFHLKLHVHNHTQDQNQYKNTLFALEFVFKSHLSIF